MKEELQTIKEACIKANPEIMELKFGCWVRLKDGSVEDSPITSVKPMSDGDWETSWGCFNPNIVGSRIEILGRPIRLADVLLALDGIKLGEYLYLALETNGVFYLNTINPYGLDYCEKKASWNLHDDNLNHQSPETIHFIASLLSNK